MSTQTEEPFAWIRQIPGDLFQLDEKPLLGFPPAFGWSEFASQLSGSLDIKDFSLQQNEWRWRSKDELFEGLGTEVKGLPLVISPLPGLAWWVMPEQQIKELMGILITQQPLETSESVDHDFLTAFYRFMALEALNSWQKISTDSTLSPNLAGEESLPNEHCLTLDISIHIQQKILNGRLFLSQQLRSSWKQHYQPTQPNLTHASPIAKALDVIIHLEAGRVNLTLSEWQQLQTGDFLFLDNCSLDPSDEDKGRVMLTINSIPYFRARIKQGNLKILEHPLYHEANTLMDEPTNHEQEDEDLFTEGDLSDDKNVQKNEESSEEDFEFDDISDSDLDLEESSPGENSEIEHNGSQHGETSSTEQEVSTIEEENGSGSEISTSEASEEAGPLSVEDVALPVVIEIGRIQMSIKKLLELQPGNMLELNIHPDSGVDLVVNGKRIARGELLRIGEAFGVRILEI